MVAFPLLGVVSLPIFSLYLSGLGFQIATAQQFPMSSSWTDYPNLSASCLEALNSTISCDDKILLATAAYGDYLEDAELNSLCVETCYASLDAYKRGLSEACLAGDIITEGSISFPPTLKADFYIYGLDAACRKDQSTGSFCSSLFRQWASESIPPSSYSCSDCALGAQQILLNSPFGYSPDRASAFDLATSNCQKSSYTYTSPSPAATTATPAPVSASTSASTVPKTTSEPCLNPYLIKDGDSCTSISNEQSVSTFALLTANRLQAYCNNFPREPGTPICLPQKCETFTVLKDQSCADITKAVNGSLTTYQLQAWNPNINAPCSNLFQLVGTQICVSGPEEASSPSSPTQTTGMASVPATTAESASPTRAADKCVIVNGVAQPCWNTLPAPPYETPEGGLRPAPYGK